VFARPSYSGYEMKNYLTFSDRLEIGFNLLDDEGDYDEEEILYYDMRLVQDLA